MVFDNLEFFNVTQLQSEPYRDGLKILRYPLEVSDKLDTLPRLNERGAYVAQQASGVEIRFITESKTVVISFSAIDCDKDIIVMKGDYVHSKHTIKAGIITTLRLEDTEVFKKHYDITMLNYIYSPEMWRICIGRQAVYYHGINTFGFETRAPLKSELPKHTLLAYGSSITQGEGSFAYTDCYASQTARALGFDVLNLGLGGSCCCENVVADFIARRDDWDIAVFEIGVNMRYDYTPEVYKERLEYLISNTINKKPKNPIVMITIFTNNQTYTTLKNIGSENELKFNEIMRDIYKNTNHDNLYLIEGKDLLTDFKGLTCDLIHPSNYGHSQIAQNLSNEIRKIFKGNKNME